MLILLAIPLLAVAYAAWALIGAATTVGNENYPAKLADWLRDHHGAFLSNAAERWAYDFDAPSKGGTPHHLNALPPAPPPTPQPAHPAVSAEPAPSMTPPPIPLVARPALAGEGRWQPVGPAVDGVPAMYEVQFRADDVYTSQITTAVEIDPHFLRLTLVPGLTQPGGTWPHPPMITHAELPDIVAAFNGGFRFADAQGGMYLDHRVAAPLRDGAASFVTYADGHVDIGSWGSEVRMTPDVVSVLQNLVPMVDDGRITPSATSSDHRIWGDTLGADTIVARSGLGVTAGGALVYVAGPALSARTLAESLQRAGAVRAMTLDINPEWVTFNFYTHPNPADPYDVVGAALYPQQQRPPGALPPTDQGVARLHRGQHHLPVAEL